MRASFVPLYVLRDLPQLFSKNLDWVDIVLDFFVEENFILTYCEKRFYFICRIEAIQSLREHDDNDPVEQRHR